MKKAASHLSAALASHFFFDALIASLTLSFTLSDSVYGVPLFLDFVVLSSHLRVLLKNIYD